jgi:Uma2 family endonuclease
LVGGLVEISMSATGATSAVRLDASCGGSILSPEEFDAIVDYDDGFQYELIHRVIVVNPIPLESETDPNDELGYWLRHYQQTHPKGSSLDATMPERYVSTGDSRRRADRVIWAGLGRLPDPRSQTPTVVIEFVSRRKRDRARDFQEKRREYLQAGVVEYWIIDRFQRRMTICRRGYPDRVIGEHQTYTTELLPGFELPLGRLLRIADRWDEGKNGLVTDCEGSV